MTKIIRSEKHLSHPAERMVERYVDNLNEKGLKQALKFVLMNPDNRKIIDRMILEFSLMYPEPNNNIDSEIE